MNPFWSNLIEWTAVSILWFISGWKWHQCWLLRKELSALSRKNKNGMNETYWTHGTYQPPVSTSAPEFPMKPGTKQAVFMTKRIILVLPPHNHNQHLN